MGVPFETIFTSYKNHLGNTRFSTLKEYDDDLIHFLEGNRTLFPIEAQNSLLRETVYECFQKIAKVVRDVPQKKFEVAINKHISSLLTVRQSWHDTLFFDLLNNKQELFVEAAESVFGKSKLSKKTLISLLLVGVIHATCVSYDPRWMGIAFVGYGDKDIFPQLIGFNAGSVINGRLKYYTISDPQVSHSHSAYVVRVGESEMIETFLIGVKLDHYDSMKELRNNMESFYKGRQKVQAIGPVDEFLQKLDSLINDSKVRYDTLIKTISSLPQSDLAQAAEGMLKLERLNLKLLDRQESTDEVVQVALITKDRFIWVKNEIGNEVEPASENPNSE
jgi:hypothetical protein